MKLPVVDPLTSPVELIDYREVEWSQVRRTAYLVHQRLRYEYPGPIRNLKQRLVVFPPSIHGGQRLIGRHLQVSLPGTGLREELDAFGNRVCHVFLPRVERAIEFEIRFLVERKAGFGGLPPDDLSDPSYLQPSPLTEPNGPLEAAAQALQRSCDQQALVERICEWVYRVIDYVPNVTTVATTAAEAFALGRGVCQDHAHVMLTLCRLLGLPARYVSGHLLGEGATHAWVEVLAPDPTHDGRPYVQALDPSHGRRCRPDYITVAVGRDFQDVTPTSGTFTAPYGGRLESYKVAGITDLELEP